MISQTEIDELLASSSEDDYSDKFEESSKLSQSSKKIKESMEDYEILDELEEIRNSLRKPSKKDEKKGSFNKKPVESVKVVRAVESMRAV